MFRAAVGIEFALGFDYALHVAKTCQVRGGNVVDVDNIGVGNRGQVGNLTAVIRTHFDNRKLVTLLQFEQGQRHADIVVQISPGRERRGLAPQNLVQHFLDRRLAVAAG